MNLLQLQLREKIASIEVFVSSKIIYTNNNNNEY